jgi:AcrR family transcriptional regulator
MVQSLLPAVASVPAAGSKSEQLVSTALRLFYRDGYHAVGIDTVLAEAGVAKMTLYKHFPSKTDLIVAVLVRQAARLGAERQALIDAAGTDPAARFAALFTWFEQWFRSPDFNGCAFIRAVAEFPASESPVNKTVVAYRTRYLDLLEGLVSAMQVAKPRTVAEEILLLTEGAIVVAHTFRDPLAARRAKHAALAIVAAALSERAPAKPASAKRRR